MHLFSENIILRMVQHYRGVFFNAKKEENLKKDQAKNNSDDYSDKSSEDADEESDRVVASNHPKRKWVGKGNGKPPTKKKRKQHYSS